MNFHQVDLDLPGVSNLPVRISRDFRVENRRGEHKIPGFSDWEIDIPRVYGNFRSEKGWVNFEGVPGARCSSPSKPDAAIVMNGVTLAGAINDIWHGYYLHVEDEADQELLIDSQPALQKIQDDVVRPWITNKQWRVGCLATTANGYGGEGFLAISPSGEKYYFDYAVTVDAKTYVANYGGVNGRTWLARSEVSLLASRVEDRFGNWVKYAYSGDRLIGISANDGRSLAISYDSNGNISSVVSAGRIWKYIYERTTAYPDGAGSYRLRQVIQPDGSQWGYTIVSGNLMPIRDTLDKDLNSCRREPEELYGEFTLKIDHPSGVAGLFYFYHARQYMNHAPIPACQGGRIVAVPTPWVPAYFDGYVLFKKTMAGPGIPTESWSYLINQPTLQYYSDGVATDPCSTCNPSKITAIVAPDSSSIEYEYGFMYGLNAGQLLSMRKISPSGTVLSTESYTYVQGSEAGSMPFPAEIGKSLLSFPNPLSNAIRPMRSKIISQDGIDYSWKVDSFDIWGRPLRVQKSTYLK